MNTDNFIGFLSVFIRVHPWLYLFTPSPRPHPAEQRKIAMISIKRKQPGTLPPKPEPEGQTRITIRLDHDIVGRFFELAEQSGGTAGYRTLINAALRDYLDGMSPSAEDTLGQTIREN